MSTPRTKPAPHLAKVADLQENSRRNRTVVGAGFTSALGDFCYETTTVILPGFLAVLGISAAMLGIIEGAADIVASFTKMIAGYVADKLGHRKTLVLIGYGLTPVGQILIAAAAGWPIILLGRIVSWFGKGLRGPLRDAIVIQAITPQTRGRAFGFHRAMDTIGAVARPLLGVALLGWAQAFSWSDVAMPFRFVLWLSVITGALAVVAFLVLVRDPQHTPNPALRFFETLRALPARFKRYLGAVALFGVGDFSHSLLILAATQLLTPAMGIAEAAQAAGLLYVWRNVVQVVISYPIGALADRFGSLPVLVSGYMLGAGTAILTAFAFVVGSDSLEFLAAILFVAGLFVAVQEALEPTVTADMVGAETLASSYGALGTVNGAAKLISSSGVGILRTVVSPVFGFGVAALLMAAGTAALAWTAKHCGSCARAIGRGARRRSRVPLYGEFGKHEPRRTRPPPGGTSLCNSDRHFELLCGFHLRRIAKHRRLVSCEFAGERCDRWPGDGFRRTPGVWLAVVFRTVGRCSWKLLADHDFRLRHSNEFRTRAGADAQFVDRSFARHPRASRQSDAQSSSRRHVVACRETSRGLRLGFRASRSARSVWRHVRSASCLRCSRPRRQLQGGICRTSNSGTR
jgi:MFS family permease